MKKVLLALVLLVVAGCNRGDIKVDTVLAGQPAPFDGYNFGPEMWVLQGDPVPLTGVIVWVEGTDPNELFE